MDIRESIDRIYRMPESSAVRLAACMSSLSRPRGYCVLEAGRVEPNLFFIGRGIARACISADGKKVTFWIGAEGSALVSLKATSTTNRATKRSNSWRIPCCMC